MRRLPFLMIPLALISMPLAAQEPWDDSADHPTVERTADRTAAILNDPAQQDRLANTMAVMVDALMRLNVGPLADVIAKVDPASDARDLPRDATLGEVMGDNGVDGQLVGDQVRSSARLAGAAASALGAYLPVLTDMARDVAAQVEQNMRTPTK